MPENIDIVLLDILEHILVRSIRLEDAAIPVKCGHFRSAVVDRPDVKSAALIEVYRRALGRGAAVAVEVAPVGAGRRAAVERENASAAHANVQVVSAAKRTGNHMDRARGIGVVGYRDVARSSERSAVERETSRPAVADIERAPDFESSSGLERQCADACVLVFRHVTGLAVVLLVHRLVADPYIVARLERAAGKFDIRRAAIADDEVVHDGIAASHLHGAD